MNLATLRCPQRQARPHRAINRRALLEALEGRHYLSVSWVGVTAINPMEGTPFQGKIADFSASNRDADDFSASIDWGDGSARFYDTAITKTSGGHFAVDTTAPHVFRHATTVTVRVYAKDDIDNGEKSGVATIHVSNAPIVVTINSLSLTKGVAFSGQVASFTTGNLDATASSYTGTIAWGDGASTTGTVTQLAEGQFTLSGSHTYTTTGSMPFSITVNGPNSNSSGAVNATQIVPVPAAPSLVDAGVEPLVNEPFAGELAQILDTDGTHSAGNYSGTANWGDGSSSAVTLTATSTGVYSVSGSHTYTSWGLRTLALSITGPGGTTLASSRSIAVAANPMGIVPTLSVDSTTDNSITLKWAGADGSDLQLEMKGPGDDNFHWYADLGTSDGSLTVPGLGEETAYAFAIRAIAGPISNTGSPINVTTAARSHLYAAPSNLHWETTNGITELVADWSPPAGVTIDNPNSLMFVVQARSTDDPRAPWQVLQASPFLRWQNSNFGMGSQDELTPFCWEHAEYRMYMTAATSLGIGDSPVSAAIPGSAPSALAKPESLAATANPDGTYTLSWTSGANPQDFRLYDLDAPSEALRLTVAGDQGSVTIPGSWASRLALVAHAGDGTTFPHQFSHYSQVLDLRTTAAPTGLKAYRTGGTSATLLWNNIPNNENTFTLEKRIDGGAWLKLPPIAADATQYVDNSLPAGFKLVEYRLASSRGGRDSATVSASVENVTVQGESFLFNSLRLRKDPLPGDNGPQYYTDPQWVAIVADGTATPSVKDPLLYEVHSPINDNIIVVATFTLKDPSTLVHHLHFEGYGAISYATIVLFEGDVDTVIGSQSVSLTLTAHDAIPERIDYESMLIHWTLQEKDSTGKLIAGTSQNLGNSENTI